VQDRGDDAKMDVHVYAHAKSLGADHDTSETAAANSAAKRAVTPRNEIMPGGLSLGLKQDKWHWATLADTVGERLLIR